MPTAPTVIVVGGGPGGLMAAEQLARSGSSVTVFEQMLSVGRKFLLAGRGGLNLTHSEPTEQLVERYGSASSRVGPAVARFDAAALRAWAESLGEPTFVGSSGRVFPESFRATPLLRAWLARLASLGVVIRTRHRWLGVELRHDGRLEVSVADQDGVESVVVADAVVLAMGGASWPKVGSDGAWTSALSAAGVGLAPFRPANCGFVSAWTEVFRRRFAGAPLKNVELSAGGRSVRGEGVVTETGVEGGVFYALGSTIRDLIELEGEVVVHLDLRPDLSAEQVAERLARRRPKDSATTAFRKAGITPVGIGLLREATANELPSDPVDLAALVKATPLRLVGAEAVERSISTAGGVCLDEVDERFMLRRLPGVFVIGEMLDWEAPTGGYLLQATFSTAVAAAAGVLDHLGHRNGG